MSEEQRLGASVIARWPLHRVKAASLARSFLSSLPLSTTPSILSTDPIPRRVPNARRRIR